ncbi:histidine phosphatase family protein [Paenibacillus eucommiae]|uniref:Broad specificity phosphatase PhoE/8-oxo-dGTP pyrophosphatase MutT (NUDIX family) n=1 Tax=Paenibacillus eucommiae TaxID=1355755 RepID=A0ABS4IQ16_9BACL|nr:histidine phosphatase family protein [Paenibacillus eucommiae]MBP1989667.1 broad specificity phosphatase PhoE/8-oxo-dGTP pyrophosphatase MutT (NUDIX family) [Paenibacillus eucommiae]
MRTKTTLFLTRHGETEWNVEGKIQGHQDSSLTLLGKRQASWLRTSLKEFNFDAIYSSTSQRTYHTAEIIRDKRKLDIYPSDSLKEINMGSWEGQKRSDIESNFPDDHRKFWNTPHLYTPRNEGESFSQLQDRIIPAIKEIVSKHRGGNILIVTHAIALKVIMAYFRGDPLEKLWTPPSIQPTALNKVEIIDNVYNIELYGDVSHYQTVRKAVCAIAYQGNKFILVHKVLNTFEDDSGVWDFPKGGIEDEDLSLEDAVKRELMEETGTDKYVIKQKLPNKISFNFNEDVRKRTGYESQETSIFLVEFVGNQSDLKPCGKEIDEIILIESESLLNKLTHKETAAYIQKHCSSIFIDKSRTEE